MSSIKVGKLPNGAECIASQDIGKFNVRVIEEKDGSCWFAYSQWLRFHVWAHGEEYSREVRVYRER